MTPELLPCPFCGEMPMLTSRIDGLTDIWCFAKKFRHVSEVHESTMVDAVRAWNTRHTPQQDQQK